MQAGVQALRGDDSHYKAHLRVGLIMINEDTDMATEEKKTGRPSDYTEELAEIICLRLAEGESLRSVCRDEGMPSKQAVLRWLARNDSFRAQYVRAKEEGAEAIAEELFDIADDGSNDWMEKLDKDGEAIGYQLNGALIPANGISPKLCRKSTAIAFSMTSQSRSIT